MLPSASEILAGSNTYQFYEPRDAMYKTARFLVEHFWGRFQEMADGLGVLLETWNRSFYRFGPFDYNKLEECLANNRQTLDHFHRRNIISYQPMDDPAIFHLYNQFLDALQINRGQCKGRKSPVGAVKALHLLAPAYFPLWDDKISRAYGCHHDYIPFMGKMKKLAEILAVDYPCNDTDRSLLKIIDEYNFAKYTAKWETESTGEV